MQQFPLANSSGETHRSLSRPTTRPSTRLSLREVGAQLERWGVLTMRLVFLHLALLLPLSATAVDGVQCRDLLMAELNTEVENPNWKFAVPDDQSMYHATLFAWPVPNTAQGDFDADNKQDVAFLIEKAGGIRLIAVCLSSRPKTVLIINPGCSDSISILQKGNFKPDTISASCAEVTADTWLYTKGKFTMIPGDGD